MAHLDTGTNIVPVYSRCLFEDNADKIRGALHRKQVYWILAVEAENRAGRRIGRRQHEEGTSKARNQKQEEIEK